MKGYLGYHEIKLDFINFILFNLFLLFFLELNCWHSQKGEVLGMGPVTRRSVHVESDGNILHFYLDVHYDVFEELLEKIYRPIFTDLALHFPFLHIEFFHLV